LPLGQEAHRVDEQRRAPVEAQLIGLGQLKAGGVHRTVLRGPRRRPAAVAALAALELFAYVGRGALAVQQVAQARPLHRRTPLIDVGDSRVDLRLIHVFLLRKKKSQIA
jgi:hypothetical protein